MKIGRNQLCPCGSGKKYKKCCLDKKNTVAPFFDKSSAYDFLMQDAEKAQKVFEKYLFQDVVSAVFCINSWRKNRSGLAQSLKLNEGLTLCKVQGTRRICSQDDYDDFWSEISPLLSITIGEDYTLPDFGEVFINLRGKSYPIIIGTGHQSVYAAMRYMVSLCKECSKEDELITILEYLEYIIGSLKSTNSKPKEEAVVFEKPPFNYFLAVKNLLCDPVFERKASDTSQIMGYQDGPIEMRHFVQFNTKTYPLFNTSILVDYYGLLLCTVEEKQITRHIQLTILDYLGRTYPDPPAPGKRHYLVNPRLINEENRPVWDARPMFALIEGNQVLFGVMTEGLPEKEYRKLQEIQTKREELGCISIVEGVKRNNSGYVAIELSPEADLEMEVLCFNSFTDITSTYLGMQGYKDGFNCTALDLFYLLSFSENVEELVSFVRFSNTSKAQVLTFGGRSNLFFLWKASNRNISSGAIEYSMIHIDYNETDAFTIEYFEKTLHDFPRDCQGGFVDPIEWVIHAHPGEYSNITHKKDILYGGDLIRLKEGTSFFLSHNGHFFDSLDSDMQTGLMVIDEINQKMFVRYSDSLNEIGCIKGNNLQILFVPLIYAENSVPNDYLSDSSRTLVYSEGFRDENGIAIRYSLDIGVLLDSINKSADRSVENRFFLELLKPLAEYGVQDYQDFCEVVDRDKKKKKTVDVFSMEREFFFSEFATDTVISTVSFADAKKEIAQACLDAGITPGIYKGKDATAAVRRLQAVIYPVFEGFLAEFDKYSVHYYALSYYSVQRNYVYTHHKRLSSLTNLDEEAKLEFEQRTRDARETARRYSRMAQYLIECNLATERKRKTRICSADEFNRLLAIADWLVVLQDSADLCHHTKWEVQIEIDEEFLVDPVYEDEVKETYDEQILRKYSNEPYLPKSDEIDQEFAEEAVVAFERDTGVSFPSLITLLDYMARYITDNSQAKEVFSNVFSVPKDALICGVVQQLEDESISISDLRHALDFIILDESNLKTVAGQKHDMIPIWEREKRSNRFEVKPVAIYNNDCIFSPISTFDLMNSWRNGLLDWFPPYEIGLDDLLGVLKKWKKRYENEMVQDIVKLFEAKGLQYVFPEVDLYRRFPKESYPEELGDYDTLAFDETGKTIWIVESKVLQKVGSIYEDLMQQKSFFFQNKYDEKFQRRITFFEENKIMILHSFGMDQFVSFTLSPVMITNKLFVSRYKKIGFPIMTFTEFRKKLEELQTI